MKRLVIISNRLPVSIDSSGDEIIIKPSVGGLATGMKSFYKSYESVWMGWAGFDKQEYDEAQINEIESKLKKEQCHPVYLNKNDVDKYYYGFSNKTIWPLFHYFAQNATFEKEDWEAYQRVNKQFADEIVKHLKEGDNIWIHDYHLFLLPKLIRDKFRNVSIGFFLHIPFPSYEIFRLLPWRTEIMEGILGSDLIGFHTYDYERHFMSCARRLLGLDASLNQIIYDDRLIKVDNFPMGIDYNKFNNAATDQKQRSIRDKSTLQKEIEKYFLMAEDRKLILSIDRLDYSKGIPHRLEAYRYFLEQNPEFREKVSLIMLAVASRESIDDYQQLKKEVDELVGAINGEFAVFNWTPIWYFYRSMPFEDLITLYCSCDIGLITPVRDGMNLVAKEFLASKTDNRGVLILSEMAGASKEMDEALIVNPNNKEEIAGAIRQALIMPEEEQIRRNTVIQKRLKRYTVEKWAADFMNSLNKIKSLQETKLVKKVNSRIKKQIFSDYHKAKKRVIFLDYDGTLVEFKKNPLHAKPDKELLNIVEKLCSNKANEVIIISGRDRDTLGKWFEAIDVHLIVEHGVWSKQPGEKWQIIEHIDTGWKDEVRPNLELYVDRTPGTFVEEKNYSLAWHYRKADPNFGQIRAIELKDELLNLVANHNLEILEGNKVIEVKTAGINKGRAAMVKMGEQKFDFIFGIGDDWTDEYLFEALPESAYTIKVGIQNTKAKYNIDNVKEVREFLTDLING